MQTGKKIPKIKICGLVSAQEAAWIVEERVDYAGIVLFYPKSHRNMTLEEARELLAVLRKGRTLSGGPIRTVAVTVSPEAEQIEAIQRAGFDRIQVHGPLSKTAFDALEIPMIRAFNGPDRELYAKCHDCPKVEAYLFDAGNPGSGRTFDWEMLRQFPRDEKPLFLAGGLCADNVRQAILAVGPDVVDVSSGVERDVPAADRSPAADSHGADSQGGGSCGADSPADSAAHTPARVGKDREKIRRFVRQVRTVWEEA